jgi:succinyl-CoA synthetase beta subunit
MPIVVRLEGAGSVEAKEILSQSGLNIIPVNSLGEAAEKAIQAAAGGL